MYPQYLRTRSPTHEKNATEACSFGQTALTGDEQAILERRRRDVQNYEPVKWRSKEKDPVSGEYSEIAMVNRTKIVFFGPVGSGRSYLVGSLFRAVNNVDTFPDKVLRTLNHWTLHWLETWGNQKRTTVYQDTKGDQEYNMQERSVHDFALRGMYKDNAPLQNTPFYF